ncbi:MAG: hypothetical protein ILA34_03535 [Bacteroidaceae bacterium]|nr:hypothetical protein [Bacteroidaceae bacterium]
MKKYIVIAIMALMYSMNMSAQKAASSWTVNTRAWSTNYFTYLIYGVAEKGVIHFALKGQTKDSLWVERIVPTPDLVFPIGMGKRGFTGTSDIYGPYHYAFGNPFKHIGDYGIGADMSYMPSPVGFYAGAYFKSQEIVFKETKDNLRGFYVQPRVGLIIGGLSRSFEAGVFYDIVTGCGGSLPDTNKDRLKGGLGLDFAFSNTDFGGRGKTLLQFSIPLHNFLDPGYNGQQGMKRKVGYISITRRVVF